MYNNSAVYDFNIFKEETQKAKIYELPSFEARKRKRNSEKFKFCAKCLSLLLTSAVAFGGFLLGQAKLTEYGFMIDKKSAELQEFKSENKQLQMRLDAANSFDNISVNNGNSCVEPITISSGDRALVG